MPAKLIEWKKIRTAILLAVYMLLASFLQSLLFSRLTVFGVRGFILPAAVVAGAMYLGGVRGMVFGIFFGLLTDINYPDTTVLYTLLFPVIGLLAGLAADFYVNRSFFSFAVFGVAALLFTGIIQLLAAVVLNGAGLLSALWTAALQTLVSLLPAALLYLPFRKGRIK